MGQTPETPTAPSFRTLPTIFWGSEGCAALVVRIRGDIPTFEDLMIRTALVRVATGCERLVNLDRAINRELWPLGYVAQVEASATRRPEVVVNVAPS